jgi:two-component system sensor kinase FixL
MPPDRDPRFAHAVLPAHVLDDPAADYQMGPVTRKIKQAESALQQRVEFEALVSRIASTFVTLTSEHIDWGINEALRQIGEFVEADHAHVFRVYENTAYVAHTHEWSSDGQATRFHAIQDRVLDEVFPWAAQRLRRLDGIMVYSVAELNVEAAVDQAVLRRAGIKSVIFLPMAIGGELVGFLGFDSTKREINWTQDAIALLNIMGTLIAEALRRKESEDALRKEAIFTNGLLNSSGTLFVVLDSVGRIVRFNPAAEEVSGYRFDEIYGQTPWSVFLTGEDAVFMQRAFNRLVAGAPGSQRETALITKRGERRVISWSKTGLPNEHGAVEYVIFSGLDITETKRLEAEVLNISEREQSRLGHDLHDGLGQHLTGIEFMAQVLQQRLESAGRPEAKDASEITALIRQAISQTRDLARGLSPVVLQSKGLAVALEDLASSVGKHNNVTCTFTASPGLVNPPTDIATHLYRIAQEAINNALKHGQAKTIRVQLVEDRGALELRVEDNGKGFKDPSSAAKGMGLRVMTYRAGIIGGSLELVQSSGNGVRIICRIG